MKPIFLFVLLPSILLTHAGLAMAPPAPPEALTLGAATRAALANNPALREARARWEAMKARVPQAAAWDDLKVGANTRVARFVDVAPNSFTDQTLTVEQMLPLSGKNRSRARFAAAEAVRSLEELRRLEFDVTMKTRSAFIRLANLRTLLELNRATERTLTQSVEIGRARLEVGTQAEAEVLTAESEAIRLTEARRDLERTVDEQETALKVLISRDPFESVEISPGELPEHADLPVARLRELTLTRQPEVRMALARVTAARAKVELARREWIPDPTVSVGAQRYNESSQAVSELTAGVSINVPWLNRAKYRAEESEAARSEEAATRALEGARREALGKLHDQLTKIETLHHHVMLFRDRLLPTVRQTVEANRTGYAGGKTGFLELITSERAVLETEAIYRQHLSELQAALAELEADVGADLGIFPSTRSIQRRAGK